MSEASLVAQEIQDLASAVGEVAQTLRDQPKPVVNVSVPEQPAPIVNVNVPETPPVAPPQVVVNVPEAPAPIVNVTSPAVQVSPEVMLIPPLPATYRVRITGRDENGFISEFVITPVGDSV